MTLAQREHPEARAELSAGANWYDDPATGQELLDATLQARRSIAEMPGAWPPIRGWDREPVVRRKGVTSFPYGRSSPTWADLLAGPVDRRVAVSRRGRANRGSRTGPGGNDEVSIPSN